MPWAVSPYLSQSRPVRWAAVHYSERSRDRRGVDLVAAWRQVLWPLTGAFQVLVRDRVPVGVVDDYQLQKGQLDGYKLLFLPNPDELTTAQRREVDRFQAKGGIVIENDPRWTWSQPGKTGKAIAAFRQVYSEYRDTGPVRVTGGPEKMHAVAFQNPDKNRLMVAITNDFTWIQFRKNIGKGKQSLKSPPPQIRDVEPNSLSPGVGVTPVGGAAELHRCGASRGLKCRIRSQPGDRHASLLGKRLMVRTGKSL
ncbi:MAG: hypothetical protein EBE86_031575 [Hormoscilla sp. GUM202]|nr:hypothetical protein [Hormoscilla sp. GUM202]